MKNAVAKSFALISLFGLSASFLPSLSVAAPAAPTEKLPERKVEDAEFSNAMPFNPYDRNPFIEKVSSTIQRDEREMPKAEESNPLNELQTRHVVDQTFKDWLSVNRAGVDGTRSDHLYLKNTYRDQLHVTVFSGMMEHRFKSEVPKEEPSNLSDAGKNNWNGYFSVVGNDSQKTRFYLNFTEAEWTKMGKLLQKSVQGSQNDPNFLAVQKMVKDRLDSVLQHETKEFERFFPDEALRNGVERMVSGLERLRGVNNGPAKPADKFVHESGKTLPIFERPGQPKLLTPAETPGSPSDDAGKSKDLIS